MILTDGASLTGGLSSLPSGTLVTSDEVGTRLRTLNLEPVSSGIQALFSMGAWVPKFPSNWAYLHEHRPLYLVLYLHVNDSESVPLLIIQVRVLPQSCGGPCWLQI